MDNLTINEMPTGSYLTRTQFNANKSDLTVACAIEFTTQGEKYTEQVAGERYVRLMLNYPSIDSARVLYRALEKHQAQSLNVAGNGMHTLSARNITQRRVNLWLHDVLALVHAHHPINLLRSGGQTGVDIAAAVIGPMLHIPTEINFPQGYKQRLANGLDVLQSLDEITQSIEAMRQDLLTDLRDVS